MGTSAGSAVFLTYGWRAASALSMAFYGWQLLVLFLRGPNCARYTWFGFEGGFAFQVEQKQDGTATPATQMSESSRSPCPTVIYFDPNRVEREDSQT